LTEFARALDFPDYFGHNWDALEECLADLEWLPAKGYILLITDAAHVLPDDEEEYETFLEVLRDAGEAWGSGQAGMGAQRATPFHVLFSVSEREKAKRAHWRMTEITAEPT
jgi:RNAse (barnase) inhibitor barstar